MRLSGTLRTFDPLSVGRSSKLFQAFHPTCLEEHLLAGRYATCSIDESKCMRAIQSQIIVQVHCLVSGFSLNDLHW